MVSRSELLIKNYCKKIGLVLLRIIVCVLVGTLLMTLVYMIPTNKIEDNVKKSAQIFQREGNRPILINGITSQCDNFTDALILLEAAKKNDRNILVSAMEVKESNIGKQTPTEAIVNHYIHNKPFTYHRAYPRYWHGNLLVIKPLMNFVDYYGFRIINSIMALLMMIFITWLLFKYNEKGFIAPYIISMLFMMPLTIAFSIQLSSCYYVLNAGIIGLLLSKNKVPNKSIYIFLYIGIATAFFDLLTYPIATFGVPCALYLFMCERDTLKNYLKKIIKAGALWGIGYTLMWISKWIIATLITDKNVLADGLKQTNSRTSVGMTVVSRLKLIVGTEIKNIYYFLKTPVVIIALIYILIMIVLIIRQHKRIKSSISLVLPFVVLMLAPCCWYAFAAEHSDVHAWFTYKALVVSAISALSIPPFIYKCSKEEKQG